MSILVNERSSPIILVVGRRGPAGNESTQTISAPAGEALSGHKLVVLDGTGEAVYASSSVGAHAGRIIGLTTGAAVEGATTTIRTYGEVTGLSGLTPGAIYYASTSGSITTTAPTSGFAQAIGHAISTTRLFIRIGQPIIL